MIFIRRAGAASKDGALRFALWPVKLEDFHVCRRRVRLYVWLEFYRVKIEAAADGSSTAEITRKGRAWKSILKVPNYFSEY